MPDWPGIHCKGVGQRPLRITEEVKLRGWKSQVAKHPRGICPVCRKHVAVNHWTRLLMNHRAPEQVVNGESTKCADCGLAIMTRDAYIIRPPKNSDEHRRQRGSYAICKDCWESIMGRALMSALRGF